MTRLLERFVKEVTLDGTEDRRPLASRQRSEVPFDRLGELYPIRHAPPNSSSFSHYRPRAGQGPVRRTLTITCNG